MDSNRRAFEIESELLNFSWGSIVINEKGVGLALQNLSEEIWFETSKEVIDAIGYGIPDFSNYDFVLGYFEEALRRGDVQVSMFNYDTFSVENTALLSDSRLRDFITSLRNESGRDDVSTALEVAASEEVESLNNSDLVNGLDFTWGGGLLIEASEDPEEAELVFATIFIPGSSTEFTFALPEGLESELLSRLNPSSTLHEVLTMISILNPDRVSFELEAYDVDGADVFEYNLTAKDFEAFASMVTPTTPHAEIMLLLGGSEE